jgi:hypothetical protein
VEKLFTDLEAKTFGGVLRAARRLTTPPADIDSLLNEALTKRNHLIHDFFFEHAADFMSAPGRLRMMAVLQDRLRTFKVANRRLEPMTLQVLERLGVSAERLEAEWQAMLKSVERGGAA